MKSQLPLPGMRIGIVILILAGFSCCATDFKLFEENGKVGLKNDNGQVLLPPAFEALGWSDGSFSVAGEITGYKLKGRWGLINLRKEYITAADFESLVFSGADRVVAQKKVSAIAVKTGCLTLAGKVTIPFVYDAITLHGLRAVVMEKRGPNYLFGLTDLDHKSLLPLQYKSIEPLGNLRYAVENPAGKLALFTDEGKPLTEFMIDAVGLFYRDHAIIFSDGLQGLIDRNGDIVVNPKYKKIELGDAVRALQPSQWKVISPDNKELQSLVADAMCAFPGNRYRIARAGKQGLIDGDLKTVWPLIYDAIEFPKNSISATKKNGQWGLLDADQREVLAFSFDSLIWDGEIALALNSKSGSPQWKLINVKQNLQSSKSYECLEPLDKNLFLIKRNGYFGLLDKQGKEMAHCVYDSLSEVNDNLVSVKFKQRFGIITTNESWVLAPQQHRIRLVNADVYLEKRDGLEYLKSLKGDIIYFTSNPVMVHAYFMEERLPTGAVKFVNWSGQEIKSGPGVAIRSTEIPQTKSVEAFHDGLQLFEGQGKFGFRDDRGRLIIPNRYDSAKHFSEGLAPFKLLGKWGYLNTDDKIVVNPTYDFAGYFQLGYARVISKGKYGLIDKQGKLQLATQYDSIIRMQDQLLVYENGKAGLATAQGRIVIQPRYDQLKILPNNQVVVKLNGSFGVIALDGLNIIPIIYDSLEYDPAKNVYLANLPAAWTTLTGF